MTEKELVKRVAERADDYQVYTRQIVKAAFEEMAAAFERGEPVKIRGFGTFVVARGAARVARRSDTGEALPLPAAMKVRFKPSPKLKERVG